MSRYVCHPKTYEWLKANTTKASEKEAVKEKVIYGIPIYTNELAPPPTEEQDHFITPQGAKHRNNFQLKYQLYTYEENDISYLLYAGIIRRSISHIILLVDQDMVVDLHNFRSGTK